MTQDDPLFAQLVRWRNQVSRAKSPEELLEVLSEIRQRLAQRPSHSDRTRLVYKASESLIRSEALDCRDQIEAPAREAFRTLGGGRLGAGSGAEAGGSWSLDKEEEESN